MKKKPIDFTPLIPIIVIGILVLNVRKGSNNKIEISNFIKTIPQAYVTLEVKNAIAKPHKYSYDYHVDFIN